MKTLQIKITGEGNVFEIRDSLVDLIRTLSETPVAKLENLELEDPVLFTEISKA